MKPVVIAFSLLLPAARVADMKGEVFGTSMPAEPAPVPLATAIEP